MHEPYLYKMVIVVRKDLNMRKGKLAAQVAHSVLNAFIEDNAGSNSSARSISLNNEDIEWLRTGAAKIVVGCSSEQELFNIMQLAKRADLPTTIIRDQGRTEFKEPTFTCCAIGPALSINIDKITGTLSLL